MYIKTLLNWNLLSAVISHIIILSTLQKQIAADVEEWWNGGGRDEVLSPPNRGPQCVKQYPYQSTLFIHACWLLGCAFNLFAMLFIISHQIPITCFTCTEPFVDAETSNMTMLTFQVTSDLFVFYFILQLPSQKLRFAYFVNSDRHIIRDKQSTHGQLTYLKVCVAKIS